MSSPSDEVQRDVLPIPDRPYEGELPLDAKDPDASFPAIESLQPPAGAPNVLVILLDDVGFAASSAVGGPCATPTAERLAGHGLRYNRFHTMALCAPTRSALLSGRNHHSVGMGVITELATAAPGYNSLRPTTCAPLAQTLLLNGYSTAQFGKCHEVPVWQTSPMGPFGAWPTGGAGFEYFYGFIGGETNQYYPAIYEGTTPVEPEATPEEGYHFTEDMTDKAIQWTRQQKSLMRASACSRTRSSTTSSATTGLFADASRISLRALRREFAVPLRLLGIGLPLTIVAGTLVGALVIPGVSWRRRPCSRSCSPVRTPHWARRSLPMSASRREFDRASTSRAVSTTGCASRSSSSRSPSPRPTPAGRRDTATNLVLEQIGYGLLGGIPAGIVGALALRFSSRRALIEPRWMQILTVAAALLAAGIASALGGSIFIAAFTGGFVFGALRQDAGGHVSELVDEGGERFDAATFIVFGAVILGPVLEELTWQVVLYAVLSLTVVRMLPVALALLGTGARRVTVAFLGWFGRRGLASIVFAVILIDDAELPHLHILLLAIAATIALSVYVHGLTATPPTGRYVRWWTSHPRDAQPAMESVPAGEHRAGPGR